MDVKGEILELKDTINTMVDQLNASASPRVAKWAQKGSWEARRRCPVSAARIDNVNFMHSNLTGQVRNIAEVATAIARGDLSCKITVDAEKFSN